MKTGERGYALLLVLLLLALGALLIAPTLHLAFTSLRSKQLHTNILKEQYTRDAGGEHAMWKLQYGGGTAELSTENDTIQYSLVINDITSDVTIKLRIETMLSGQTLAHPDFKVMPGGEVSPTTGTPGQPITFNYTLTMQQIDPDPATGYVDEVWILLPVGFSYVAGSSAFEGSPIADPIDDYNPDWDMSVLHWLFDPAITFEMYGQIKSLTLQAEARLNNNERYGIEVGLKPRAERSGKCASVVVGNPTYGGWEGGRVQLLAESDPIIAVPNQTTEFIFTISITNVDIGEHGIDILETVLAPGFTYTDNSSAEFPSNITSNEPVINVRPDGREELKWDVFPVNPMPIAMDEVLTQKFRATATPTEAGTSYAEVFVKLNNPGTYGPDWLPGAPAETYSWQIGPVIVPQYDVRSAVPTSQGWGNVTPGGAGVSLESWHIEPK